MYLLYAVVSDVSIYIRLVCANFSLFFLPGQLKYKFDIQSLGTLKNSALTKSKPVIKCKSDSAVRQPQYNKE